MQVLQGVMEVGASFSTAGVMAATWAHAALRPQSQIFGRTIVAGKNTREVAFTYDDGPNERSTPALLDLFEEFNVKANFFMIGRFVRESGPLARRVHAAGHLIANHTMTHPWLAWQSAKRVRQELGDCQKSLQDALGFDVTYFRPPHGARRPVVLRAARELGLRTVQWNAMGSDWNPIDANAIAANVLRDVEYANEKGRGANILLHDGCDLMNGADRDASVTATRMLLERFQREGRRIVTVDAWA